MGEKQSWQGAQISWISNWKLAKPDLQAQKGNSQSREGTVTIQFLIWAGRRREEKTVPY